MVGRLVEQQQVGLDEQHRRPAPRASASRRRTTTAAAPAPPSSKPRPFRIRAARAGAAAAPISISRSWISASRTGSPPWPPPRPAAPSARCRPPAPPRAASRRRPAPPARTKPICAPAGSRTLAGVGLQLARDQAQQRRLAGAVAADQAEPLVLPGRAAWHPRAGPAGDPQGDVVEVEHGGRVDSMAGSAAQPRACRRPAAARQCGAATSVVTIWSTRPKVAHIRP